jgi:hypothetical protein
MDNKSKILSNELQLIDNSINKRIKTFYTVRNSSGKKNKQPPLAVTASPIQYKVNLFNSPKSYKSQSFFPNYFNSLNKELNPFENKKNKVNNRNRSTFLSSFINYTSRNNNELKYNNKYDSFTTNSNYKSKPKSILSDIDYITNSIKLSGTRKISFDPYLKTNDEITQRNNYTKVIYPHQKNSILYYIKCTSPVQNKKISLKTSKIIKSYNQKKKYII